MSDAVDLAPEGCAPARHPHPPSATISQATDPSAL